MDILFVSIGKYKVVKAIEGKYFFFFLSLFFSVNEKKQKRLLNQIIQDTDEKFLQWAISQIADWKKIAHKPDCIIHGTKDRLIPIKEEGNLRKLIGGHFIIVQRSEEITSILEEIL